MITTQALQTKQEVLGVKKQRVLVKKDWLIVSVLTLVVAILWIGWSIYEALNTSTVPAAQEQRLKLFSTNLDDQVITDLSKKKQVLGQSVDENARVILILPGETISTSSLP